MSLWLKKTTATNVGTAVTAMSEGFEALPRRTQEVGTEMLDAAFAVHQVQRQIALPVAYGEVKLEAGYRIDLLVESAVIVEVKSVEALAPDPMKAGPSLALPLP